MQRIKTVVNTASKLYEEKSSPVDNWHESALRVDDKYLQLAKSSDRSLEMRKAVLEEAAMIAENKILFSKAMDKIESLTGLELAMLNGMI